jgi:hypothetical protein
LWETEEGRRWLARLVVATLYLFGLKRGVGMDTQVQSRHLIGPRGFEHATR